MIGLQPLTTDSVMQPWDSSPEFDDYDSKAKAYNQKMNPQSDVLDSNQLIQQAAQIIAENPELVMAL